MNTFTVLLFYTLLVGALCKGGSKNVALTESLGQEVIELGSPVKELPRDVDEEPSAENDVEVTSAGGQPSVKKDAKKTPVSPPVSGERRKLKDVDKISGKKGDEDDKKIEKELEAVYKDTSDYNSDEDDGVSKQSTSPGDGIHKLEGKFKFSPDNLNDRLSVEKFKTSIDDISCGKLKDEQKDGSSTVIVTNTVLLLILAFICL